MQNFTIDAAIAAWLAQPRTTKTHIAYEPTLRSFRDALQGEGLDLLSDPTDVARVVTSWACTYIPKRAPTKAVSRYAYNQRLAILSDFYTFLNEHYRPVPPISNPIQIVRGEHNQPVFAFDMNGPWGRCLSHFLQSLKTENT